MMISPVLIRRFIPFIFAGILGVVAVVIMQRYLQTRLQDIEAKRQELLANFQDPVDVIVAREDIPEGTQISPSMLERSAIPTKFIQPYATSRAADIVGLEARVPIAKGEQLQANKLRKGPEIREAAKLSELTPRDKRAITIGTDVLTGVGGFIRPGDNIDIIWTFNAPSPTGQGKELITATLFQNVKVLAVGNQMLGKSVGDQEPSRDYTVTIALTPQETELLLYAREQGQVSLSLRSHLEKGEQVALTPANMDTVVEAILGTAAPEVEQPEQRTIEVFKGLERSLVTVNN